ncbi:MAG: hypothetical protein F6K13_29760, partial [Okeania sp. SIO2B9]|nr:hypothetical protein [Okeania sp. SIO2B9]
MSSKHLVIIDGSNLAYRLFHARRTSKYGLVVNRYGVPITISNSFLVSARSLVNELGASNLAIAFDPPDNKSLIRKRIYPDYKANRKTLDNQKDFNIDLRNTKALVKESNIPCFELPDYEADDIIATLSELAIKESFTVTIVSNDADLLQLVDDVKRIKVLSVIQGNKTLFDRKAVIEK